MEFMGRLDGKTLIVREPVGNPLPLPLPTGRQALGRGG
jgi:hypothetical protein